MSRFKLRTLTDKEFQNGITQHIFELFDQPLTLDDFWVCIVDHFDSYLSSHIKHFNPCYWSVRLKNSQSRQKEK